MALSGNLLIFADFYKFQIVYSVSWAVLTDLLTEGVLRLTLRGPAELNIIFLSFKFIINNTVFNFIFYIIY